MALTAYDGLAPTMLGGITTNNNGTTSTTNLLLTLPVWKVNDYCVVLVESDSATDPNDVHSTTTPNIAFTKLFSASGMSVWIGRNTTSSDAYFTTVSINFASGCVFNASAFVVTNSSGFTSASNATANVAVNTDFTVTVANIASTLTSKVTSLQVGVVLARKTSTANHAVPTLVVQPSVKPASLLGSVTSLFLGINGGVTTSGRNMQILSTNGEYAAIGAVSAHFTTRDTNTGSGNDDWLGGIISFQPATILLDDFSFKIDTGPLLNSTDGLFPLYDVDTVTGLSDLNVENSLDSVDGTDGSYASAQYLTGKTIVIDGTIYTSGPFSESLLDTIKSVAKPKKLAAPFYYKPIGKNPRVHNVFPVGFRCDVDRLRALNQAAYEIQLISEDAYSSSLAIVSNTLVDGSSTQRFTTTIEGNGEAYPIIYFTVAIAEIGTSFGFINLTWIANNNPETVVQYSVSPISIGTTLGGVIKVVPSAAGMYRLDFKNRILQLYTIDSGTGLSVFTDKSSDISIRNWWTVLPIIANTLEFQYPNPSAAAPTIVVPDAWS